MISPRGERVLAHSARRDKTLHVVTREDLPTYSELMLPTLRAVEALGGSSTRPQISERVMKDVGLTDEHVALAYPANDKSIALDRCDWARSYLKLGGVLESPRRGLFLITELGRTILALSDDVAQTRLREIDAQVARIAGPAAESATRKVRSRTYPRLTTRIQPGARNSSPVFTGLHPMASNASSCTCCGPSGWFWNKPGVRGTKESTASGPRHSAKCSRRRSRFRPNVTSHRTRSDVMLLRCSSGTRLRLAQSVRCL